MMAVSSALVCVTRDQLCDLRNGREVSVFVTQDDGFQEGFDAKVSFGSIEEDVTVLQLKRIEGPFLVATLYHRLPF